MYLALSDTVIVHLVFYGIRLFVKADLCTSSGSPFELLSSVTRLRGVNTIRSIEPQKRHELDIVSSNKIQRHVTYLTMARGTRLIE